MTTPEQQAREMLERMGIQSAYQRMSAGELVELANLIAEHDALKAELAAIKGAGEPVAWALWLPEEDVPRQLHLTKGASQSAEQRWQEAYQGCAHVPLYTRPAVPLTEEQIDSATAAARDALMDHVYEYGTAAEGAQKFVRRLARAIEAAHGIKGAKS